MMIFRFRNHIVSIIKKTTNQHYIKQCEFYGRECLCIHLTKISRTPTLK